ncbi:hypothetical protein CLFO_09560 [Clostridium formicaceticum]|uniref:Transposase n=1 Tax=Clostridium formicaceticum TaxID=1497 RepID=A0AAC9RLT5_9CLOT|nr:hypothetical protein CLFO_09560 [Clostridium formicaceticum]
MSMLPREVLKVLIAYISPYYFGNYRSKFIHIVNSS